MENIEELENSSSGGEAEESDNDEIHLTLAQALELMEETWINEKFAPELLPNRLELVECLLLQIKNMEENLESLSSSDFQKGIYQLEVDRLRYLISSYLRTRIVKIENFCVALLRDEAVRSENGEDIYMSRDEIEYATKYSESIEQHFESALSFWPGAPPEDWKSDIPIPNKHSFVFIQSKADVEGVILDEAANEDNDLVDFKEGSRMIISYNSVSNLVKNGDVRLI